MGRGPLAGPVTVCAVLCSAAFYKKLEKYEDLTDSKKLSEKNREHWYAMAQLLRDEGLISYSVVSIPAKQIDTKGIAIAIQKALDGALAEVVCSSDPREYKVLLDGGLRAPVHYVNQETIIKGDQKEKLISLASIIAKVTRDRYMVNIAKKYPMYGFDIHKGYGTKMHREQIKKYGLSEIHRKKFCTKVLAK